MKRSSAVRPLFLLATAAGLALAVSAALRYTPQEQLRIVPARHLPGKVHLLPATLETTQWGCFDNAQPPVLHVSPGDTVVIETLMHSHNLIVPGADVGDRRLRIV